MNVILYMPPGSDPEDRFKKMFNRSVPPGYTQTYIRFDDLTQRLQRSLSNTNVAIFMIADEKEISDLISMGHYLSGLRIILILPDKKKGTLDLAFKLYPRYVDDANGDYDDLSLVIQKMTQSSAGYQAR
jgi:hypothetical protein